MISVYTNDYSFDYVTFIIQIDICVKHKRHSMLRGGSNSDNPKKFANYAIQCRMVFS